MHAGYAVFQLSKALLAHDLSGGSIARFNARRRISRWQQVIENLLQGAVEYGSRTPIAQMPAWVTLEVVTGGFATGNFLAGGELTAYERELAASIPGIRPGFERLDINAWHLTDDGLEALHSRLARCDYAVDVPEEAALLTVAWLVGQQRTEQARALIDVIGPFFDRLRFFPSISTQLPVSAAQVHIVDAGQIKQLLTTLPPQAQMVVQKQTIETRLPLYDSAVSHFLLTYEAGWPCRYYPRQWHEQAAELAAHFNRLSIDRRSSSRVEELFSLLGQCSRDSQSLTGRQVGRIRQIVDDFVRKHGEPGSAAHRASRANQRSQVAGPEHHLIARIVAKRLSTYPEQGGLADFAELGAPITAEEASAFGQGEGIAIPPAVQRRLQRCRSGTISELIEHGLITSGDTVARLLPAMTAQLSSYGLRDEALRMVYASTYRAFCRRRSLLLLNLQRQVGLSELPWVAVIEGDRQSGAAVAQAAQQALVESSALTLSAFPYAILPNKLLQEFSALADTAALDLPFVEEVAADIFMGKFSDKFADAARRTGPVLAGSLYARYYAIDTDELASLVTRGRRRARVASDAFAKLCAKRAGAELDTWHPATNGSILEQQQILTTQNLALLFEELGLKVLLQPRLGSMVQACFEWICKRHQMRIEHHHARLIMLKNTAYAWRQMVFYLTMLDDPARTDALASVEAYFATQPLAFRGRFLPLMSGLRKAFAGEVLPQQAPAEDGARVFLGWTTTQHWLLPPHDSTSSRAVEQ
ncbi:hypothetical protein [Pseudomonas sp. R9.37]|uniref:hypothetical protein n=1 Tax=Pseudomonas sp. R9.37 TaxID=1390498 RepID=UPI000D0CF9CE|nr:hypothetical protein [Pseudomonas sp. R9.37]PSL93322.1 hypothetical protein C7U57_13470 [Pseudomonas sp. R9.37]